MDPMCITGRGGAAIRCPVAAAAVLLLILAAAPAAAEPNTTAPACGPIALPGGIWTLADDCVWSPAADAGRAISGSAAQVSLSGARSPDGLAGTNAKPAVVTVQAPADWPAGTAASPGGCRRTVMCWEGLSDEGFACLQQTAWIHLRLA